MIIEITDLTRRFGNLTAVNDITLSVAEGELFGLVGSDGAGKTTILRMLAGVLNGTSGEARVLGRSHRNLTQVQDEIGYMSQRFGLYPDLTVAENIRFYADLFGVGAAERLSRTDRLLGFSGLAPFADRQAGRLSGGMKQKLGLCCALIHTPKLLLLDEPTNGVDPVSRRDFWRILDELRREGVTIVVATAYLDEAERCDRIALVHQGRLLACDTMAGLGKLAALGDGEPTLEEIFVALLGEPEPPSPPHHVTDGGRTGDGSVTMENLSRSFGDFTAVDDITLTIPAGQIFGFLGPNGAGKSTTIRMLCGILPPTSGNGTVAGFDLATEPERIKERIGYMSQRFSLYEDLTVEENIAFYAGVYRLPAERRKERTEWTIRMAGLEERRTSRANELATGWRQRLALGCAILHEPPIVFLDEPTSGVDPLSRRRFWDLIRDLSRGGTTIFVTTHYMDEAEFCDRLALIYRGRLIAIGSPAELKKDRLAEGRLPSLEEVFIDLIEEHDRS